MRTPVDKITFHFTNRLGNEETINTTYAYSRDLVINLLEKERAGIIFDIRYTVNDTTYKLDYFNTEV